MHKNKAIGIDGIFEVSVSNDKVYQQKNDNRFGAVKRLYRA